MKKYFLFERWALFVIIVVLLIFSSFGIVLAAKYCIAYTDCIQSFAPATSLVTIIDRGFDTGGTLLSVFDEQTASSKIEFRKNLNETGMYSSWTTGVLKNPKGKRSYNFGISLLGGEDGGGLPVLTVRQGGGAVGIKTDDPLIASYADEGGKGIDINGGLGITNNNNDTVVLRFFKGTDPDCLGYGGVLARRWVPNTCSGICTTKESWLRKPEYCRNNDKQCTAEHWNAVICVGDPTFNETQYDGGSCPEPYVRQGENFSHSSPPPCSSNGSYFDQQLEKVELLWQVSAAPDPDKTYRRSSPTYKKPEEKEDELSPIVTEGNSDRSPEPAGQVLPPGTDVGPNGKVGPEQGRKNLVGPRLVGSGGSDTTQEGMARNAFMVGAAVAKQKDYALDYSQATRALTPPEITDINEFVDSRRGSKSPEEWRQSMSKEDAQKIFEIGNKQ